MSRVQKSVDDRGTLEFDMLLMVNNQNHTAMASFPRHQHPMLLLLTLATAALWVALPVISWVHPPPWQHHRTTTTRFSTLLIPSEDPLVPHEENPDIDVNQHSISGVAYRHVLQGLQQLYPPESLEERNAASRMDGYWPFVQRGHDPPQHFTYGEFDVGFFAQLLDRVNQHWSATRTTKDGWKDKVFCDIGSGTGCLVLAAAALHPNWKLCRGIEILPGISNVANEKLQECHESAASHSVREASKADNDDDDDDDQDDWVENEHGLLIKRETPANEPEKHDRNDKSDDDNGVYSLAIDDNQRLPLAPIEFVCGSFEDPYLYFADVDCVFCFSSCMSDSILQSLSQAIGRQCQPGTLVITTDVSLPLDGLIEPHPDDDTLPYGDYQLELMEHVDGYCWLTGGHSTAYIHRVIKSLWEPGSGPRIQPELPASEQAFRAIQAMEEERDESAVRFLAGVRNNMVFAGFPESWLPDPHSYQSQKQSDPSQD